MKPATIKIKRHKTMKAFNQYQVQRNGMLIKSFYDKAEATEYKNKLNNAQEKNGCESKDFFNGFYVS